MIFRVEKLDDQQPSPIDTPRFQPLTLTQTLMLGKYQHKFFESQVLMTPNKCYFKSTFVVLLSIFICYNVLPCQILILPKYVHYIRGIKPIA